MLGAKSLAATLKESSQLTFLSLEWNQIGSDGAMYLAEALSFNTSLLHVDLRNNNIGDEGALELSRALEANDTLKTLDLRWNQVRPKTEFETASLPLIEIFLFYPMVVISYYRKMHYTFSW
jgi:Ran GTPase-activating protein (RanGAP) involved in mRNA processing and transport